ncbi:hypothetical protein ACFQ3J_20610 [Paenibacillus provencensis]|uniref:MFS transporter n=1 Tax=Paenibacillus provencensis TaxID=441151 RepID=A0ABW3PX65_9BACL
MLIERKRSQPLNTPQVENNLRIIAIITAICLFGDAMLYAVLPVYSKDFGLTALWQVGLLLSINRFIRFQFIRSLAGSIPGIPLKVD